MASARFALICALAASLAGCRAEAPRQSLKDYAAVAPAPAKPAAVTPAEPAPKPAAIPSAAMPTASLPEAAPEPNKDRLNEWCWDRYRQHLEGKRPETLEEKQAADNACRLVVCPDCKP